MIISVNTQRLHENGKWILCDSNGVYILIERSFLAASRCFINILHLQQSSSILDPLWRNNTSNTYQELNQNDFFLFDPKKVVSFSSHLLATHKKNHTCLTDSQNPRCWRNTLAYNICHNLDIYRFVKPLASPPSTIPSFLINEYEP